MLHPSIIKVRINDMKIILFFFIINDKIMWVNYNVLRTPAEIVPVLPNKHPGSNPKEKELKYWI